MREKLKFLKKYGGVIYIAAATLAVALVLILSNELPVVVQTLGRLDARWMWAGAGCIVMYLLMRSATLLFYLRTRGCRVRLTDVLIVTGVGQFYSAITPSSSGGQPMQVLSLYQKGVPVSLGTAAVGIKFIGFELAFLLMGGVLWIANIPLVNQMLWGFRWLVTVGYVVNALLVAAVLLTMVKCRLVDRALSFLVRTGARLRLLRDEEKATAKARATLEEYRTALLTLRDRPFNGVIILLLSMLQIFFLMSVCGCLYRAFHLTGFSDGELMTMQLLLFITASFVPLPGAAGAQEGGFLLFFKGMVPETDLLSLMLCWRLFTYYLLMILGLAGVVADSARGMLKKRREEKHER